MRLRLCVAATLMTSAFSGVAYGIEATIYPGVGIGKVRLGMTAAQVTKALGKDFAVNDRDNLGGRHFVEYGWNYSRWTVKFAQRGRMLRAVQVETVERSQKTVKGVGPGTLWRRVVRTYAGGECSFGNPGLSAFGSYLLYLVSHRGGTQTLYMLEGVATDNQNPNKTTNYRVLAVRVRTRFEQLEDFGPNRRYVCKPGWQNTDTPEWIPVPR